MPYKKLISDIRLRESTSERERNLIIETESDKARIIFSAPFRRLQKKAQVFPLEQNAAVRSRLTHSLEVAMIGRQIAQKISIKSSNLTQAQKEAFVNIVESACLLHDIGNPPFGHFGESAISEWFKKTGRTSFKHYKKEKPEWYADLERFEGNAQGLRIITKLQSEDEYGLNLTCSTISAYLKYTHPEFERAKHREKPFTKKNGYFLTEKERIEKVWEKLGLQPNTRHPLTFVMEAADDIAYCLSDVEDGIEKKLISVEDIINHIKDEINKTNDETKNVWSKILEKTNQQNLPTNKFITIRTTLINRSTSVAAEHYISNEEKIINNEFKDPLINKNSPEYKILEIIRGFVAKRVYTAPEAELLELTGYSAITGILEKLKPLLDLSQKNFEHLMQDDQKKIKDLNLDKEKRLLNLIPKQCKKSYKKEISSDTLEWFLRAHLVVDYISGMTDDFALDIYQKLSGIKTT
ncbi:dGTPase [Pseudomonas indica]|uniref:dGTPase n=1 Tax=Pseudomonas indica TaxID=137658 RepID=UPI0023F87C66|nr:dGTPase [Pseudomonas indica]MBU3054567.1 dGTPase [Pseudomonas indica]